MLLSVTTPIVTAVPGARAEWERSGTVEDLALIAETAERLGYHHLTCSEHVGVPASEAERRGARYWDPLATFGFLAARTVRIRFATNVLVLGYHHPLEIAKRYGTLDVVSNGRLILGVGVGTLKEEFDLLDVPYEDRGPRANDALRALRVALSQSEPAYDGPYHSFAGLIVDPCAVQERVPLWVGGRTLLSLRRAITLGDGWCPFGVSVEQARRWLAMLERPPTFDVVLRPNRILDPIEEPQAAVDHLRALQEAGATIASARFIHRSLAHFLEQLEALVAADAPAGTASTRIQG
jgi:probable F420-dependent oxidoreductase